MNERQSKHQKNTYARRRGKASRRKKLKRAELKEENKGEFQKSEATFSMVAAAHKGLVGHSYLEEAQRQAGACKKREK